jgi:2,5-diamino-6-(ribosylamino)-4(3H)-pyrimidinone 5'-phosphate reductase
MKVIMHNSVSLDGSFVGFDVDMGTHYKIAAGFKADATLIGSDTFLGGIKLYGGEMPPESESDFSRPERDPGLPYWIIVDTKGKTKGLLHICRRFEYCRDTLVLVSGKTNPDFIEYLEKRDYDYLVCGKDRVDFELAFLALNERYGIKTIMVDSGPKLNGVLLSQGLVDEISLLISPVLVGGGSDILLSRLNSADRNVRLKLLSCESLGSDLVWVRYRPAHSDR